MTLNEFEKKLRDSGILPENAFIGWEKKVIAGQTVREVLIIPGLFILEEDGLIKDREMVSRDKLDAYKSSS